MAKNNVAVFTKDSLTAQAVCINAKSSLNDNVNAVLLLTAGSEGGLIRSITAKPRGAVGASIAANRLDVYTSSDGTSANFFLINTTTMLAQTISASAGVPSTDLGFGYAQPRLLKAGEQIWVAIGTALATGVVFDAVYENF